MKKQQIKLCVTGMDHRSELLFKKVVEEKLNSVCQFHNKLSECDVAFIDMDYADAETHLTSLKENYPDLPLIILSIKPQTIKGAVYIRKPLQITSLLKTLRLLFPQFFLNIETQGSLSAAATDKPNDRKTPVVNQIAESLNTSTAANASISSSAKRNSSVNTEFEVFSPELLLISYLKKAVAEAKTLNTMLNLELWNKRFLLINPESNCIITNIGETAMRSACIVPIRGDENKVEKRTVKKDFLNTINPEQDKTIRTLSIDAFLWQLGLQTARGRFPLSLDGENMFGVDQPVFLRQWPNLTRLDDTPNAQRIAALLIKQPLSVEQIYETLNIPRKDVLNLFFAAFCIDLAGQALRPSDRLFAPEEIEVHRNRKLLSGIFNRLQSLTSKVVKSA